MLWSNNGMKGCVKLLENGAQNTGLRCRFSSMLGLKFRVMCIKAHQTTALTKTVENRRYITMREIKVVLRQLIVLNKLRINYALLSISCGLDLMVIRRQNIIDLK
jgi:hypothetical protein